MNMTSMCNEKDVRTVPCGIFHVYINVLSYHTFFSNQVRCWQIMTSSPYTLGAYIKELETESGVDYVGIYGSE